MFNSKNTSIICIDIQEKLVNMLKNPATIQNNVAKLMQTAAILDVKTIITEQYPKGLGETVESIKLINDFKIIEKVSFSALQTSEFERYFKNIKCKNVVVFGIETHICVYQTVTDLIEKGYEVYVVADCCASRNDFNHDSAINLMKQKGAFITTFETVMFDFLKSSKHEHFKEIQALIK